MNKRDTNKQLRMMGNYIILALLAVAAVLIVAELISHRHGEFEAESLPLFPAIYGFVSFVLIVFLGIVLRKIVMRPEDYYEEGRHDDE
jgi:uncharacterized oligopeptide transporter (OPT) family protein